MTRSRAWLLAVGLAIAASIVTWIAARAQVEHTTTDTMLLPLPPTADPGRRLGPHAQWDVLPHGEAVIQFSVLAWVVERDPETGAEEKALRRAYIQFDRESFAEAVRFVSRDTTKP